MHSLDPPLLLIDRDGLQRRQFLCWWQIQAPNPVLEFLPTLRHVALFTTRAKLTVMHVVVAMASNATAAQNRGVLALGRCFLVAALARDLSMGAF